MRGISRIVCSAAFLLLPISGAMGLQCNYKRLQSETTCLGSRLMQGFSVSADDIRGALNFLNPGEDKTLAEQYTDQKFKARFIGGGDDVSALWKTGITVYNDPASSSLEKVAIFMLLDNVEKYINDCTKRAEKARRRALEEEEEARQPVDSGPRVSSFFDAFRDASDGFSDGVPSRDGSAFLPSGGGTTSSPFFTLPTTPPPTRAVVPQ